MSSNFANSWQKHTPENLGQTQMHMKLAMYVKIIVIWHKIYFFLFVKIYYQILCRA